MSHRARSPEAQQLEWGDLETDCMRGLSAVLPKSDWLQPAISREVGCTFGGQIPPLRDTIPTIIQPE